MTAGVPRWLHAAFVCSLVLVNPYVRGDGNGYYAWLVSPIVDHDVDFANQYGHGDVLFRERCFSADGAVLPACVTPAGRIENQWSVGPAVLWAPWFVAAHAGVRVARALGSSIAADGYSWPYRYACAVGTAVYGWLALLLGAAIARELGASARAAWLAVVVIWGATPLPVYQYFLPFHVPALAACSTALFLWLWVRWRPQPSAAQWIAWGAAAGLMTLVYQLDAVFLIAAVPAFVRVVRTRGAIALINAAWRFALPAALVWTPQLVGKALVYGTPFTTGYHDVFGWTRPLVVWTAVSANHGLFLWTPIAALAVAGLCWLARRDARAGALVVTFAVFFYAVSCYQNWHGASSFGNRFFVAFTAPFVAGLAALASTPAARSAWVRRAAAAAAILLMLWNAGLAFQWGTGLIPNVGPVDFRAAARQQVTEVPRRAAAFAARYFTARGALTRDIERRDASRRR